PERLSVIITPDIANLTFAGNEVITLDVKAATDRIVLNAADLAIKSAILSEYPRPGTVAPSHKIKGWGAKIVLDKDQQTATFVFDHRVAPGRYEFALEYTGTIYKQASGLFALDYTGEGGKTQRAIFTQFENSDARRFIPCWDEPGAKAVYSLSVRAPAG